MAHNHNHIIKDKMPLMVSCDEATYMISNSQHQKLRLLEWLKLKLHLLMCIYCRRYEKQIRFISKMIAKLKQKPQTNLSNYKLTKSQKESLKEEIKNHSDKK